MRGKVLLLERDPATLFSASSTNSLTAIRGLGFLSAAMAV